MILIDYREDKEVVRLIETLEIPYEITNLKVGDYLINDSVLIERKTVSDYSGSLKSQHLFNQAYQMSMNYPRSYIVIVGNIMDLYGEDYLSRESYISSLSSLNIRVAPEGEMGFVTTINVDNEYDFTLLLKYIHEKHSETKFRSMSPLLGGKKKGSEFMIYDIVSRFPNVGEELAKRILTEFKTIKNIVNSDEKTISKVNGIGKKKSEDLYNLFRTEYTNEEVK